MKMPRPKKIQKSSSQMYSLLAIAQRLEVLKDFRLFFARVIGSQLGQ